eukprot:gnl/MRDRNA2_/MRDRNA2_64078_c0_seq1.p1 gnl/MRDRNA2_/MRDRNA2_64078_c0~~gnl/MRDRNA2_/MRDRNA2_64078_c0_seq1.p1  ORF type:complete len:263 (+),score=62.09 gnl/MRDRNA2_/MRDRNA2_64078_c0_seq1:717-1505(+)
MVTPRFVEGMEVDEDSQSVLMGSLAASELSASVMSIAASIASSLASGAFSFRGDGLSGSFNNGPPLPAIPSSGRQSLEEEELTAPALPPPPAPPPTRQLPQPPRLNGKLPQALFKTLVKPRLPPTAPPLPDDPLSVIRVAPQPRTLKAKPFRIEVSPKEQQDEELESVPPPFEAPEDLLLIPPPPPPPKRLQNPNEVAPPETPPLTERSLISVEYIDEELDLTANPVLSPSHGTDPLEDSMVVHDGSLKPQSKWAKGVCAIS